MQTRAVDIKTADKGAKLGETMVQDCTQVTRTTEAAMNLRRNYDCGEKETGATAPTEEQAVGYVLKAHVAKQSCLLIAVTSRNNEAVSVLAETSW